MTVQQKHSVSILPYNAQGEVLLQQRDHTPGIRYPGTWTFFGGAVEGDESHEAAARRELWEEIELDIPLRHWLTYTCPIRSIPGELDVIVHVFVGFTGRPVDSLTLHEGQAMDFYDAASAEALEFGFGKKPYLMQFFEDMAAGRI